VSAPRPLAAVSGGELRGVSVDGGVRAFLGVPYASAPLGRRRWAAPAPAPAWSGVLEAVDPAPPAPQPDRPIGHRSHGELGEASEDCLRLNLFAPPAREGAQLPVFVWLHGGGWVLGSPSAPVFDGASLALALDAVVVMVCYRLGSLGWLYDPALAQEEGGPCGNWGMLDQLAALRWAHANAAAFGGDPHRVVLAGESAGAASVIHALGAEGSAGLVRRAIAMSPPLGESTISPELALAWSEALAQALGGEGATLEPMRAAAASEVVAAHERLLGEGAFAGTRGGAMPVRDGVTIAGDPLQTPAAAPQVDVLVGTNADEATFFYRQPGRVLAPDDDALAALVARLPGIADADAAIAAARAGGERDNNEALVRIASEAIFTGPVTRWASERARAGARVHRYRLEHRSPQPGLGAVHTIGVPLLFGTHRSSVPGTWVAGDDARADRASAALQAAWRGFVHDGDPGWAPVDEGELGVLGGGAEGLRVER
jgi:para-nitrobenzyl esterase